LLTTGGSSPPTTDCRGQLVAEPLMSGACGRVVVAGGGPPQRVWPSNGRWWAGGRWGGGAGGRGHHRRGVLGGCRPAGCGARLFSRVPGAAYSACGRLFGGLWNPRCHHSCGSAGSGVVVSRGDSYLGVDRRVSGGRGCRRCGHSRADRCRPRDAHRENEWNDDRSPDAHESSSMFPEVSALIVRARPCPGASTSCGGISRRVPISCAIGWIF
jgi:hypothetical protein